MTGRMKGKKDLLFKDKVAIRARIEKGEPPSQIAKDYGMTGHGVSYYKTWKPKSKYGMKSEKKEVEPLTVVPEDEKTIAKEELIMKEKEEKEIEKEIREEKSRDENDYCANCKDEGVDTIVTRDVIRCPRCEVILEW